MKIMKETKRALAVECRLCAARVGEHCTADSGKSTKPHAVRVARSNGLKPVNRRAGGGYQKPRDGIEYTPEEQRALDELDSSRGKTARWPGSIMLVVVMTACGVNSYELPTMSVDADVKMSCDVLVEQSTTIEPKRLCVVDEWDPSWRVFHVAGYVGAASDGRALVGPVEFHPVYGPIVIAQKPNGACDAVLCNGSDPP